MNTMLSRLRHTLAAIAWMVLVSAISVSAVAAQTTETYTLSDERYAINFPASWEVTEEDDGTLSAFGPDFAVFVYPPEFLLEYIDYDKSSTPVEVLVDIFPVLFEDRARAADVEAFDVGDRAAARYETEQESDGTIFEYRLIVLTMSDDEFGLLVFGALPGTLDFRPRSIDPIPLSFDVAESMRIVTASGSAGNASGGGEPCFVSVDSAQTARLRVGPGENRTSVAFLPPNDEFSVTGRFEAADGSVWYQLDKEEAAPQSAANEIWVSADEVETVGDCDTVGDTAAPPVVPIVGGGGAGGQAGGGSPPTTGAIPLSGTWRFVFNPTANASCQGGGNVVLNTSDVVSGDFTEFLTVLNGGAQVRWGGDTWVFNADTGEYIGIITLSATSEIPVAQIYLRVTSASTMSGSMVGNAVFDGFPCSVTLTGTLRRG